jgi:hypothetical protein
MAGCAPWWLIVHIVCTRCAATTKPTLKKHRCSAKSPAAFSGANSSVVNKVRASSSTGMRSISCRRGSRRRSFKNPPLRIETTVASVESCRCRCHPSGLGNPRRFSAIQVAISRIPLQPARCAVVRPAAKLFFDEVILGDISTHLTSS